MRPSAPEGENKRRIQRALIIGVIIILLLAGYVLLSNYEISQNEKSLRISEAKLQSKSISPEENTHLKIRVSNTTDTSYDNLGIQVATSCSKLKISYGDKVATEENKENRLTIPTQILRDGEKTKLYAFDISGELFPGLSSMTVKINIRVITENEVKDEREFNITIENLERA